MILLKLLKNTEYVSSWAPPAFNFFIITRRLILSGPEFHKNL